jgi:hypothetical protein
MSKKKLKKRINEIPGGEWWHPHNGVTYLDLAKALMSRGFTENEAVEFLETAYGAAADEFGG